MTARIVLLLGMALQVLAAGAGYAETGKGERASLARQTKETPTQTPGADSRGYLTTPQELMQIRIKAGKGIEPYKSAVGQVLRDADRPWPWPALSGEITCPSADEPAYIKEGSRLIYAKALAYQLTGQARYAQEVQTRIAALLGIGSFGPPGNTQKPDRECQLILSWSIPGFIRAADLLESDREWQASGIKPRFQTWLAEVVYPTISFSAEVAVSNWGAAATNASAYIADYLWDRPELRLVSYNRLDAGEPTTARSPAEAFEHANHLALDRVNGSRAEGRGGSSSSCDFDPATKSMIRPDGGIPDELRRGSTGCAGTRILENDHSNMYSQTHLQNLIAQAELLLRRGDRRLYDNLAQAPAAFTYIDGHGAAHTVTLPAKRGSLHQAILFILTAPSFQTPRALKTAAEVAYRYYRDPAMKAAIAASRPNSGERAMAYETLTHGFAEGENPGPPPTVPPPGAGPQRTASVRK